ncbi:hypothetical protein [Achromobacter sp. DH1f]|uniref:hypothetical protein n=1 Tax=Achromobacter sp. DH1f TaxID=1397275 RepID=UPI00046925B0|nr:hypothetical protein [Achromobacter sp. DH1f]
MPQVIEREWHFNQETLLVQWAGGRVVGVVSVAPARAVQRRPAAPQSRRQVPAAAPTHSEQRLAA